MAKTLADEGFDTVVVTKDLPLRLKAAAVGIPADEYRSELAAPNEWPGIATVDPAPSELIDALYEGARVDAEEVGHELLTHTSVILRSGSQSAIARVGSGSRVFLTHDVAQRDNLRVGRDDGIATIVSRLKGHSLFAHVSLTRSERSPIAEVAGQLLDEF